LADSTAQIGYNKKAHLNKMSFQADRTGLLSYPEYQALACI
jgi:hypothetical protein